MTKTYKLLRDFPNVNAGEELTFDGKRYWVNNKRGGRFPLTQELVEENPEWFELQKRDWEVLEVNYADQMYKSETRDGIKMLWNWGRDGGIGYTVSELLAKTDAKIHSVKRVSDNEIFTVGDRVRYGTELSISHNYVLGFEVHEKSVMVELSEGHGVNLLCLTKLPVPYNVVFQKPTWITQHAEAHTKYLNTLLEEMAFPTPQPASIEDALKAQDKRWDFNGEESFINLIIEYKEASIKAHKFSLAAQWRKVEKILKAIHECR